MPTTLPAHNHRRGEISACFSGKNYRLCLTLRALAELEAEYNAKNLFELSQKFTNGKLSATDVMIILAAGLRGAGESIEIDEVSHAEGAIGFVKTCIALLKATFSSPETTTPASLQKKSPKPSHTPSLGKK